MKIFKNMKLGQRLGIGFFIIILLLLSLSIYELTRMRILANQTISIYNHPMAVSNAVLRININIIKIHRYMEGITSNNNLEEMNEHIQTINELEQVIVEDFKIINERFLGDKRKYRKALHIFREWKPIRDETILLIKGNRRTKAINIITGKEARHIHKLEKSIEEMGNFAQRKARDFIHIAKLTQTVSFISISFLMVIVIIIGVVFSIIITKSITVPLEKLKIGVEKIGNGDLDTIISIDTKDEIGQLAFAFNNMTKDLKSITASRDDLDKEITERKKAENTIQAALKEKETLLREIHHRVKNNMATISSFLKLQGHYNDNNQLKIMLDESVKRIRAMSLIHEKLYAHENLATINAQEYIKSLVDELLESTSIHEHKIKYIENIEDIIFTVDTLVPCGLIINELVTNSLKHAFNDIENPEISISLENHNKNIILKVSDNGIGYPEGLEFEKANSLGMNIVNQLVKQLEGDISIESNTGVKIIITFKNNREI